ncbi:XRE family transcriptional regulator [Nocardiopsis dassonvillei]|nr:XRE family transcriptional regulator [Nocardiopsis dassonvillei]
MAASRFTETDVAAHLDVDPKTVRRWLSGQRPYPRHRWALADLLQTEEDALWPQESQGNEAHAPISEHVQRVYAHRWQVPREVWWDLFSSAEQEIGILVYSGLFIADDAGMLGLLRVRAQDGVNVRILLGDPYSHSIQHRGNEEQIGETLAARARNALLLFRASLNVEGVEIRVHSTVLYNSIYLTEKKLLINQHSYGFPAAKSPVIEIDCGSSQALSHLYTNSFETVWREGKSIKQH